MRRLERTLVSEYISLVTGFTLTPQNLSAAAELAALPDGVRGYEDVKLRNVAQYHSALARGRVAHPTLCA
jgi:indolepyruvate ferredoxin oxidoreductase